MTMRPWMLFLTAVLITLGCDDGTGQSSTLDAESECCAEAICPTGFVCQENVNSTAPACGCVAMGADVSDDTGQSTSDTQSGTDTQTTADTTGTDTTGTDTTSTDTSGGTDATDTADTSTGNPPLDITWPTDPADNTFPNVVYVHELQIPEEVDASGNPTCCYDFGPISKDFIRAGTDNIDNSLAKLLNNPQLKNQGIDINATLDISIRSGGVVVLFDHLLLDGFTDPDGFVLAALSGRWDTTTTNYDNASIGLGDFYIDPVSFKTDSSGNPIGEPSTVYNPATMDNNLMEAGPGTFLLRINLGGAVLELPIEQATVRGDALEITADPLKFGYGTGTISGYVETADFRGAINDFVRSECACLTDYVNGDGERPFDADGDGVVDVDLYGSEPTFWVPNHCLAAADVDSVCDPLVSGNANEEGCVGLVANPTCTGLPLLISTATDIDTNNNTSAFEAISAGLVFKAVPANILGMLPDNP